MKVKALSRSVTVDRLLLAATTLGEVLRAYPWLILLSSLSITGWPGIPLSLVSSFVILAGITIALSFALSRNFHLGEVRVAGLSLGIILILLMFWIDNNGGYAPWDPAWFSYLSDRAVGSVAGLLFGFLLLWRGITIAREELTNDYLYRNFAIGIAGFAMLTLIWAVTQKTGGGAREFTTFLPYILAYFFTSLMGLGISNFLSLRQGTASRPRATDLFARRWLLLLLGIVLGIVVIGGLVALALSTSLVDAIARPLNVLADWIGIVLLYGVMYPLAYLVEGIGWIGQLIMNLLMSLIHAKPFEPPEMEGFGDQGQDIVATQIAPGVLAVIKWVVLIAVIGLIVYLLWRTIYRYWRGPQDKGYEEVDESLWSWRDFTADLKGFLGGFANRFRSAHHPTPPLASTITSPQPLDIREIYRGLLWEGAQIGHARFRSQTPYEYQSHLEFTLNEHRDTLSAITEAYVRGRYGGAGSEDSADLTLVLKWLELRSAMRGTQGGHDGK